MLDYICRGTTHLSGRSAVGIAAWVGLLFLPNMLVPAQAQQIEETDEGWVYHWDPEMPLEGGDPLPTEIHDPLPYRNGTAVDGRVSITTPEPSAFALAAGAALIIWTCGARRRRSDAVV